MLLPTLPQSPLQAGAARHEDVAVPLTLTPRWAFVSRLAAAAALAGLLLAPAIARAVEPMNGAGSSAAHPVYRIWAEQYKKAGGAELAYDPAGSSAGLQRIRSRQVDFGATDVAPKSEDLARDGLVLFPTVITGVVPVVNLPKVDGGRLVLTGEVLARIFAGEVTHWDAPEIRALNPGLALPAKPIAVVVRSDGSGTTYNFSDYLAKVSPAWKQKLGVGTAIKWPAGVVPAKGSKGVVEAVQATPASIGYVDYNYVVENKLKPVALKNAEGAVVEAGPQTFHNALLQSAWMQGGDFTQTLTNLPGRDSWPITMGTFVVMPRVADKPASAMPVIRFFTWAFLHGDDLAKQVNFVRLPTTIQAKSYRAIASIVDRNGAPIGVGALR